MFVVVLTGAPGAGKSVCLTALSDALTDDGVAHAAIDVDEVAWAYPFPTIEQRCEHLRVLWESHRRDGHETLLVAETIESPEHLGRVLSATEADGHLLVHLDAPPAVLRARVTAREPPGWSGLDHLLGEVEPLRAAMAELPGVHLALDSERLTPEEIAGRVRGARPDRL